MALSLWHLADYVRAALNPVSLMAAFIATVTLGGALGAPFGWLESGSSQGLWVGFVVGAVTLSTLMLPLFIPMH